MRWIVGLSLCCLVYAQTEDKEAIVKTTIIPITLIPPLLKPDISRASLKLEDIVFSVPEDEDRSPLPLPQKVDNINLYDKDIDHDYDLTPFKLAAVEIIVDTNSSKKNGYNYYPKPNA